MDIEPGSRFNAYTIRKAIKHTDIEANKEGRIYLKDDALTMRFCVDVLTLESRSTLKAAHSAENSEQASKAIEAAKKVAAVEAKTAAKQQPGADHDCVTQAAENAVQMVEWLHDLANVPKGVVPEPVGRSLQKDMRAMLRRVLPQYQGEDDGPLFEPDPLLEADVVLHVHHEGYYQTEEETFQAHSFMLERSPFCAGALNFAANTQTQEDDDVSGKLLIHWDFEPELVRAALHYIFTDELPRSWRNNVLSRAQKAVGHFKLSFVLQLPGLTRLLERALCEVMTPEIAVRTLETVTDQPASAISGGDRPEVHPFPLLTSFVLRFIALTLPQSVANSPERWNHFVAAHKWVLADLDESCIESGQHMDTADYRELHALRLQHYPDSAAAAAAEDPMDMAGALAAAAAAGVMAVVAPVVMAQ